MWLSWDNVKTNPHTWRLINSVFHYHWVLAQLTRKCFYPGPGLGPRHNFFFLKKKEIPIFIFNPLKGLKNKNQPYREYKLSLDLTITWLPDEEQTRAQTQNDLIIELLELTKTSESVQQCIPPTLRTWFFVVGFSRPFLKLLVSQILFQEKRHGSD